MHFNFMKNVLHYWKDDFDALVFSKIKNSCSVLETSFIINTRWHKCYIFSPYSKIMKNTTHVFFFLKLL